ncbi:MULTISPECIES: terpene synthase family protein [unclassified Streptomyces]|uniref:terpene synthase family protein n=1 Tax=unclassified Streptomyces TaxID=2593676 RepID=UPI00380D69F0
MPPVDIELLPANFRPPAEPEINPLWPTAEEAFKAFARRTSVITEGEAAKVPSMRYGYFTAICLPHLPQDELDLHTQWNYMFSVVDDVADEADSTRALRLSDDIVHALRDPQPPEDAGPAVVAMHDLWTRTAPQHTPPWRERALANLMNFLHQYAPQSQNRARDHILNLQDYIDLRRVNAAVDFAADLLEAALQIHLPEPVFATAQFRELRNCFIDANTWYNDYFSFERELAHGDTHNLALVLAAADDLSHREALATVLQMTEKRLETFLRIEQRLPQLVTSLGYGPAEIHEAQRFASALKTYTHAHLLWAGTSSRYNAAQHRATDWT